MTTENFMMSDASEIIDPSSRPEPEPGRMLTVAELGDGQHDEWDDYVVASSGASFFHRTGWMRAVRDHYGHKPCYLYARRGDRGRVCGVLPLFLVAGPLTGRAMISTPYAVNGGIAADSADIEARLVAEARDRADRLGVRYLELRNRVDDGAFTPREHYYGFRATLPEDPEQVLGRFPRKARAEVRKARDQFKLTARFGHDLIDAFYSLYVISLRRLGSPGHSLCFLRRMITEFGDDCLVQVVSHEDQPVAGVMSFRYRDRVLPYYAGIDERFNKMNSSNFLYFSLMEHAVGIGLRVFDFGRTRRDNLGGCQFKINQGFDPEPLTYSYYSPLGVEPPDLRPSNGAFSRLQEVWRRLPIPIAGPLGGLVSRWLP
jgi:FemAB-related protein (PEP-CTERM system-associated)